MTTNNPETNLPELPDGYGADDPIAVHLAPDTWYLVGEDGYITPHKFTDWVDWNPTWTFTVINGKKGKS